MQCEVCGVEMILTESAGVKAWVCTGWPACKTTAKFVPEPKPEEKPKAAVDPPVKQPERGTFEGRGASQRKAAAGGITTANPLARGNSGRNATPGPNGPAQDAERLRQRVAVLEAENRLLRDRVQDFRRLTGPQTAGSPWTADTSAGTRTRRRRRLRRSGATRTRPRKLRWILKDWAAALRDGTLPAIREPAPGGCACRACGGTGKLDGAACDGCNGNGWTRGATT